MIALVGTAAGAPKTKNFVTVLGKQEFGQTGDVMRQEVDCPKGYFAINGGYLTSGVVVSTWENFPVRHPDGWVAKVYAPPTPPPLAPMDDVSISAKVDCAKSGVPLVLPIGTGRATAPRKAKNFVTVLGHVKEGKSGDKLRDEVDCPKGYFALNGGYLASGILISTWENFPVRHPDGWVSEVYAPPNGPFGPAQDVSLRVKVDCAKSGVPLVLPPSKTGRAPTGKPAPKKFVTLYGPEKKGKSGDVLHEEVDCPKGWFAFNGGSQTSGTVSTWKSFAVRNPDGWEAQVYVPPAGPFAPPQDVSLQVKVECAKRGIPVVLPTP